MGSTVGQFCIAVSDLEESVRFYTEIMGLVEHGRTEIPNVNEVHLAGAEGEHGGRIQLAKFNPTMTPQPIDHGRALWKIYIYVDDAARAVLAWAQQMRVTQMPVRTVLVASGIGTSLAQLIRTVHDVAHRKVPVALGAHPSAVFQALDLRFVPTPLDHRPLDPLTPLPVGVRSVVDDIRTRVQLEGARAR